MLSLLLLPLCLAQLLPISLRQRPTGERSFIDSDGRETTFHGINAIVKGPPWYPDPDNFDPLTSLTDYDLKLLADAGVNSIRLGAMWPGIEPVRGQYNMTYMAILKRLVANAAQHGIYTLLDMHQDDLSEFFCGEGVPAWAVSKSSTLPFPSLVGPGFTADQYDNTTGFPTRQACGLHDWPSYEFAQACSRAYMDLYTNVNGVRDSWGDMWAFVAQQFRGQPEVLGLELINEPWAGDIYADPLLLIPGVADKEVLQPAYDALNAKIRQVDDDRLIFFAGTTWSDLGAGFSQVPGGPDYANRSVLAIHYYEPPQFANSENFDFSLHRADARRLQSGLMLTEFGSPGYNSGFENDTVAAEADLMGWMMWEWKDFCRETDATRASPSQFAAWGACKTGYGGQTWTPQGLPDPVVVRRISRTYPRAVAGFVQTVVFNATNADFSLVYNINLGCQLPTEIFVQEQVHYPKGLVVLLDPPQSAVYKHDVGSNRVYISHTAAATDGQELTVFITSAQ